MLVKQKAVSSQSANAHKECVSDNPSGTTTAWVTSSAVRASVEVEDSSNTQLAGVVDGTQIQVRVADRPRLRSTVQFSGHLSAAG